MGGFSWGFLFLLVGLWGPLVLKLRAEISFHCLFHFTRYATRFELPRSSGIVLLCCVLTHIIYFIRMEGVARDDNHKIGMVSDLTPLLYGNKLIQPLHGKTRQTGRPCIEYGAQRPLELNRCTTYILVALVNLPLETVSNAHKTSHYISIARF